MPDTTDEYEMQPRAHVITTGWPVVDLLACVECGVLLWDIDKHYKHAHPAVADPAAGDGRG